MSETEFDLAALRKIGRAGSRRSLPVPLGRPRFRTDHDFIEIQDHVLKQYENKQYENFT